jgi:hypothetical protein
MASGAGLAIFVQQVLFQRTGVDADADGTAVVAGGLDHLAHPVGRTDVARVDAQAGGAGLGGLDGAFVVEMDVGHDRHRAFADDFAQGPGRGFVGGGDADNIGPGLGGGDDLRQRGPHVRTVGVGHGLDRDRRVAPHGDAADHDLARFAAFDVAPGADRGSGTWAGILQNGHG